MKIQCDVCKREEASVFCTADEASLCNGCDSRVHHANKLASKHRRFSLIQPSSLKEAPRCDICQERRAFLFCQEDRAILCRECDLPIHTANHLTQKHNRFLLTGIKLSSSSSSSSSSSCSFGSISNPPASNESTQQVIMNSSNKNKKEEGGEGEACSDQMGSSTTLLPVEKKIMSNIASIDSSQGSKSEDYHCSTSSISEYLIETIPGWHVEDLLASSGAPVDGPCEIDGFDDLGFVSEAFSIWVPQVRPMIGGLVYPAGAVLEPKNYEVGWKDFKERRWNIEDAGFTVPEISSTPPYKRSKLFNWQI